MANINSLYTCITSLKEVNENLKLIYWILYLSITLSYNINYYIAVYQFIFDLIIINTKKNNYQCQLF